MRHCETKRMSDGVTHPLETGWLPTTPAGDTVFHRHWFSRRGWTSARQ
jgi:hypothetical protein